MTTIYLVRHGQASFGKSNYDELSENGEAQAQLLGRYFKNLFTEQPYIVSGSMKRHQQTTQISLSQCFPQASYKVDGLWNEFNHQQVFSLYEPRFAKPELLKQDIIGEVDPRAYLAQIFDEAIARWINEEFHHEYDESWPTFKTRVDMALKNLCIELTNNPTQEAVVFTSGGVISVIIGKLLELSVQRTFALSWSIANTSVTTLKLVKGELQLVSMNEHQFIKSQNPDLLTWL
ncbi:histidine phosphatase family protein [Acinetobacter haemolyticus]|uniref:histidine phosphatase family protein n=1 Tax=Acinetobacter haemolyticus TaxID=29430 RepID=UPI000D69EDCE|nr:histidine phosphatase family protein [Acinetobacter haemolyticus]